MIVSHSVGGTGVADGGLPGVYRMAKALYVTVAVPLPTATFCVHEVSGLDEVEETAVADPAPEMLVTSDVVPGWPLNALPWTLAPVTEQSSLTAIVPV